MQLIDLGLFKDQDGKKQEVKEHWVMALAKTKMQNIYFLQEFIIHNLETVTKLSKTLPQAKSSGLNWTPEVSCVQNTRM